jgi:uncharacterized protein involved in outer membrane biogenesis
MKKKIKLLLFFLAAGSFVFSLFVFLAYSNQSALIQAITERMNEDLTSQTSFSEAAVAPFEHFPYISMAFYQLQISRSEAQKTDTLLQAETLYFSFNVWDLLKKKYRVSQIYAQNGEIRMKTNAKGRNNFEIFKKKDSTQIRPILYFDVRNIRLENVKISYSNAYKKQKAALLIRSGQAELSRQNNRIQSKLAADLYIETLDNETINYISKRSMNLQTSLNYDIEKQQLDILPFELESEKTKFKVSGQVLASENQLDIRIEQSEGNLETVLSYLPPHIRQNVEAYGMQAKMQFVSTIKGKYGQDRFPQIEIKASCEDGLVFLPHLQKKIEKIAFKASFTNGSAQNARTSALKISQFEAVSGKHHLKADLTYSNFSDPLMQLTVNALVDAPTLNEFLPPQKWECTSGEAELDWTFEGKLETIRAKTLPPLCSPKAS